jgi:hypothetical protein
VGLVLFTLYQTGQASVPPEPGQIKAEGHLPAPVLTAEERAQLADAAARLAAAEGQLDGDLSTNDARRKRIDELDAIRDRLAGVVGQVRSEQSGSIRERLEKAPARGDVPAVLYRADPQAQRVLDRARRVREANFDTSALETAMLGPKPDVAAVKARTRKLREEVVLLHGMGELPADNVRNLGLVLYSQHLLAIELAGTLLLVAVIGAIAVAHRKEEAR